MIILKKLPFYSGPSLKPEPRPLSLSLTKSEHPFASFYIFSYMHISTILFILQPLGPIIFLAT